MMSIHYEILGPNLELHWYILQKQQVGMGSKVPYGQSKTQTSEQQHPWKIRLHDLVQEQVFWNPRLNKIWQLLWVSMVQVFQRLVVGSTLECQHQSHVV